MIRQNKRIVRKIAALILLLLVIFAVAVSAFIYFSGQKRISVVVVNHSDSRLDNIVLKYNGGNKRLASMRPGDTRKLSIQPAGESGMAVEFTDGDGFPHRVDLNVYLEPTRGTLDISIGKNLSVQSAFKLRSLYP